MKANFQDNFEVLRLGIVFDITNATICFFHLALPFSVSSFVVRRYDDIYLIFAKYTSPNKILCLLNQ